MIGDLARPVEERMSGRLAVAALAAGLVLLTGCGQDPAATASPPPAAQALDATVRAQIDELAKGAIKDGVTGVVVAVHDPAKGDLLAAYGASDTAGTPMTPDLHYRIASVTKTFTATAVLELADRGKLALDDPISKYVTDMPNGDVITLRNLLGMRSGLYEYSSDPSLFGAYTEDPLLPGYTLQTGLDLIRAHAPAAPPNQQTVYTDSNFLLLGFAIEKASGIPAPQYLEDLARRTGLADTTFPTTPDMPEPAGRGYTLANDKYPKSDVTRSNTIYPWTAGAIVSTVPDMLTYAPLLAGGAGLEPATWEARKTTTPLTSTGIKVGYGLGITEIGDWVGHDGSIAGYSNVVVHRPQSGTTIVVMVNAGDGPQVPALEPFLGIAKLLYPDSLPTW
jgi:D-alanyl-D-alanine carboxypeptidase